MKRLLKITSFCLALFLLGTHVGLALNVHRCGDHIASISWAGSPENCEMDSVASKTSCALPAFKSVGCCSDTLVIIQDDSNKQFTQTTYHFPVLQVQKAPFFEIIQPTTFAPAKTVIVAPPSPTRRLFLHYHQFTFYG